VVDAEIGERLNLRRNGLGSPGDNVRHVAACRKGGRVALAILPMHDRSLDRSVAFDEALANRQVLGACFCRIGPRFFIRVGDDDAEPIARAPAHAFPHDIRRVVRFRQNAAIRRGLFGERRFAAERAEERRPAVLRGGDDGRIASGGANDDGMPFMIGRRNDAAPNRAAVCLHLEGVLVVAGLKIHSRCITSNVSRAAWPDL